MGKTTQGRLKKTGLEISVSTGDGTCSGVAGNDGPLFSEANTG